jgi:hypothetical protein
MNAHKLFVRVTLMLVPWLAASALAESYEEQVYSGAIGGKLQIQMNLEIHDAKVFGTYFYEKHKKEIWLDGTLEKDGKISLLEWHRSDEPAATFKGRWIEGRKIEGTWTDQESKKSLPFAVELQKTERRERQWRGLWDGIDANQFASSSVKIFEVTDKTFSFEMDAYSGAHTGFISGTANIDGDKATFTDGEKEPCRLSFTRAGQELSVESDNCGGYGGMGVGFDGKFAVGAPEKSLTLVDREVLQDEAQEVAFKKLVGADYEHFTSSFQMVSEDEDLDGFGAKVRSGGVRGAYTAMEAIVMIGPAGKIWAAAIDPEADEVHYHTNVPDWTDKLPKTIENWRQRFAETKVVFRDKK